MTGTRVLCPQCGGENELPSGLRLVRCVFCETSLFTDRSGVVSHYEMPPLLDRDQAGSAVRRWMAGNETVKNLDRKSEVVSLEALSFPMWLFRVDQDGDEVSLIAPAAPIPIPDLMDFELPPGRIVPYSGPAEGVEAPEVSVPMETAKGWAESRHPGSIHEIALIEVPFWRCRYRYQSSDFVALVDAISGGVLASFYPEKSESPYLLVAGLGFIVFLVEGLVIQHPIAKALAYGLTAIPLVGIAYWVARKV